MSALAQPARFAPNPQRRALLAKVHLAKKEMAMVEDDYRQLLADTTGHMSAGDCSEAELTAMVEAMKSRGFKPRPAGSGRRGQVADHPSARKARALWISLYQLGAIDNSSDQALEAFARRQLGCDRLQWANQGQSYKLIEALKAIAERHGWSQEQVTTSFGIKALRLRLAQAILAKLKARDLAGADWSLETAAFRLLGIEREASSDFWELGDIDALTQGLGAKLRTGS